MHSQVDVTKTLGRNLPIICNLSQKTETEGILSKSFYESKITLVPKPKRSLKENYK